MQMSIGDDLTVEVRPGAPARAVKQFAHSKGFKMHELWCGDVRLDDDHPAGQWPLLPGARLTPTPAAPCAPPRGPFLEVMLGPDAGTVMAAGRGRVTLGRAPEADVCVRDPQISRRHLQIDATDRVVVRDLGSTNGTTMETRDGWRQLRRERHLADGAEMRCGQTLIRFRAADDPDKGSEDDESGNGLAAVRGSTSPAPHAGEAPLARPAGRFASLMASAGGGVVIAAATGRWWLAIVGLAYPVFAIAPMLTERLRRRPGRNRVHGSGASPLAAQSRQWDGHVHVSGDHDLAEAYARAIAIGRGRQPPEGSWIEPWMMWLPAPTTDDGHLLVHGDAPSWADVRCVVSQRSVHITNGAGEANAPLAAVRRDVAEVRARAIAGREEHRQMPDVVAWADLRERGHAARPGLRVPIAVGDADFTLDFDAHGPHILVAGTTGSGKSGLLETLVLSATARYSPSDLTVALIDFKGGAGLAACIDLPHVAGELSDLEPHLATRALLSLGAELRARKVALTEVGHASFGAWEHAGGCPARMLVVIDEYQDLAAASPDFLPHVVRIATQGRSLGLHVVLATQRPAGAVTPEIRANVTTTIALRCASDSESRDLIGTGDAAAISPDTPGRAIVATGSTRVTVQCAQASATPTPAVRSANTPETRHKPETLAALARSGPAPQPLWLPPLPSIIEPNNIPTSTTSQAPGPTLTIGIADDPHQRVRLPFSWNPGRGTLAVSGPRGSGRTTALRAAADAAHAAGRDHAWLPADPRLAMRTLERAADEPELLLLIDDTEARLSALDTHTRGLSQELIRTRLDRLPTAVAFGPAAPARLVGACPAKLVLGALDHIEAGAWSIPRELATLPDIPGRGRWFDGTAWFEAQVTEASPGHHDRVLAAPLPNSAVRHASDTPEHVYGIGTGGDEAITVYLPSDQPVCVVGEPTREREATVSSLVASARAAGTSSSLVTTADNPFAVTAAQREAAAIIVARPTIATVREFVGEAAASIVDAYPTPLRVVLFDRGEGQTVQLYS